MRIERVPLAALGDHIRPIPAALASRFPRVASRFAFNYQDAAAFVDHAKIAAAKTGKAAVVTGQQPAFLMGPLYNFYKAATAVRVARWLISKGVPSYAVFWNHSDDDKIDGLDRITTLEGTVTARVEGEGILAKRTTVAETELMHANGSLSKNFTSLLKHFFGDELTVVEPSEISADAVCAKSLQNPGEVEKRVQEGGAKLKELGFAPALTSHIGSNVYAIENGVRHPAPAAGRLSAGVALRLIVQDTALPTAVYIGGPNEVAYIAQLKELYAWYGLGPPAVMPRIGATLLEPKVARALEKLGLSLPDAFKSEEQLHALVAAKTKGDLMARIDAVPKQLAALEVDPPLKDALHKTTEKVEKIVAAFKERVLENQKLRDDNAANQVKTISSRITPEGKLQERVVSIWPFVAHAKELVESLDPFCPDHQVVRL